MEEFSKQQHQPTSAHRRGRSHVSGDLCQVRLTESRTAGVLTDDPSQNTKQKAGRRNVAVNRCPRINCD